MAILRSFDLDRLQKEATAIRDERTISIILVRGGVLQPQQDVRLGMRNFSPSRVDSLSNSEVDITQVTLYGAYNMNIMHGDRFTHSGQAYLVLAIHPNRDVQTVAFCEVLG